MSYEPAQQKSDFSEKIGVTRQKTLREHILGGDDVFASIVEGPQLAAVKHKAAFGRSVRFTIAGATAVVLEPEIRELLRRGMTITRETYPQLFEGAFEIDVYLDTTLKSSLDEIDRGFLQRGLGTFPALQMENFLFFDFRFPVVFCQYEPEVPGIKGSLHIPQHIPWKNHRSVRLSGSS